MKLRVLDLFSGIGGFSLGLERTGGFETVAFCEIDAFCRKVLDKHWPNVPCFNDVTKLRGEDVGAIDVICGGFPCQDISIAGLGAGLDGARSGLWSHYARLIRELRPSYVIVENVSALLNRGLDRVLGDLAALGYNAEWHCIPASAVGAPHVRDRLWIVADPHSDDGRGKPVSGAVRSSPGEGVRETEGTNWKWYWRGFSDGCSQTSDAPHADQGQQPQRRDVAGMGRILESISGNREWPLTAEPAMGGGVDGLPNRMDRLGSLGNAVVPQIPELIGNAILESLKDA